MLIGAGASLAVLASGHSAAASSAQQSVMPADTSAAQEPSPGEANRAARMQWWHVAKFGMFIHFGVYSQIARSEWAMVREAIPITEYTPHARLFTPLADCPRIWAKLAKRAGMKYMVMTTKHHEGFCNFDTKLTKYSAPHQGPGRDIVREYVEAARAEDLRVGFYYSLMDWHHPDGAICATDEAARKRFVEYTHGLIRELMTNYGKVDILWYDGDWPLDANGWESVRMNQMVYQLQPQIVVNNRNRISSDFSTPEQHIRAETGGRAWEACMTINESWGYQRADNAWKNSSTIVRNLISCARGGGNYLLNVGPRPDGSIPEPSVQVLTETGQWLETNGEAIYESEICTVGDCDYASFTRKGNTLYMHVHFWQQDYLAISGLKTKAKSARILKTGQQLAIAQSRFQTRITGLPLDAPDFPVTTLIIECESEPTQDTMAVRREMPREGV
jgi:alpha-L-fucosidase